MINVQIDVNGNFTICDYNYSPECARQDEYLEIKAHFEAGKSDKYEFVQYVAPVIPEPSIHLRIAKIESEAESLKTPRLRREAALGLEFKTGQLASDRLIEIDQEAEEKIAELRKQL